MQIIPLHKGVDLELLLELGLSLELLFLLLAPLLQLLLLLLFLGLHADELVGGEVDVTLVLLEHGLDLVLGHVREQLHQEGLRLLARLGLPGPTFLFPLLVLLFALLLSLGLPLLLLELEAGQNGLLHIPVVVAENLYEGMAIDAGEIGGELINLSLLRPALLLLHLALQTRDHLFGLLLVALAHAKHVRVHAGRHVESLIHFLLLCSVKVRFLAKSVVCGKIRRWGSDDLVVMLMMR